MKAKTMRSYLPRELRRRYDIAWKILPDDVRDELRAFIINIKAVTSMEGASIKRADGEVIVSGHKALGWYIPDESAGRGYIRLCTDLEETDEPQAVCHILHEFAHAHEHQYDNWRAESRWPDRSELAACAQVAAWAARDYSNSHVGGYENASSVALLAILMAKEEWKSWWKRERGKDSTDKSK